MKLAAEEDAEPAQEKQLRLDAQLGEVGVHGDVDGAQGSKHAMTRRLHLRRLSRFRRVFKVRYQSHGVRVVRGVGVGGARSTHDVAAQALHLKGYVETKILILNYLVQLFETRVPFKVAG